MNLPFKDGSFDAAYAIEATCHAPDRVRDAPRFRVFSSRRSFDTSSTSGRLLC